MYVHKSDALRIEIKNKIEQNKKLGKFPKRLSHPFPLHKSWSTQSFLNVRWTFNLRIDDSSLEGGAESKGNIFILEIFILLEFLFQAQTTFVTFKSCRHNIKN